ncbi:hypothetical protein KIN20_018203 [Parelaphostrongylus tenuis]|uniref:Uncharacterized protein n=1 Tax=Parelaphostrongylus tenuis TaxID=148309 RepID=A0AAD5N775_PARTN|nr:hypothetical protein KIN20_018203 [Parelaphostrongylus tenuis]
MGQAPNLPPETGAGTSRLRSVHQWAVPNSGRKNQPEVWFEVTPHIHDGAHIMKGGLKKRDLVQYNVMTPPQRISACTNATTVLDSDFKMSRKAAEMTGSINDSFAQKLQTKVQFSGGTQEVS